jgi:tetratricopeptide (TPR) repeat protein
VFSEAYAAHRAGRLDDAERGYRALLAADPTHAQALHMLGVVRHQRGQHDEAADLLHRAAELAPGDAGLQLNLGNVLKALGRFDEALVHFDDALRIQPDFGPAHYNLGNAYASEKRFEEAVASYSRAARAQPGHAPTHNNLGTALQALGRHEQARDAFLDALRLQPSYAGAYNNLGTTLNALDLPAAALDAFLAAVRLKPDFTIAHFNLGNTFDALDRLLDAHQSFSDAVRLQPHFSPARFGLGNVLAALGRPRDAIAQYEQAVGLEPAFALAWMNLGATHYSLGAFDAALRALGQALRLRPELAAAHYNRALILLLRGAFREGWEEYEWRLRLGSRDPEHDSAPAKPQPDAAHGEPPPGASTAWDAPRWTRNEPLGQRTLLVHAEQGFGDTLQFARFVRVIAEREQASLSNATPTGTPDRAPAPARILLEVQPELLPLLAPFASNWGVTVLARGARRPAFDYHCPLLSLPRALFWDERPASSTEVPPRPAQGYLSAPDSYRRKWRGQLAGTRRRKLGIAWSGRILPRGETRALPVAMLEALLALPDIDWFVLQTECSAGDRTWLDAPARDNLFWPATAFDDFADTAACIEQLDAIVSIDTAVAHLAGALGKPLWIMLPFVPDWRWFLDSPASPWYPNARLIRQAAPGDWSGVVSQVRDELAR